MSLWTPYGGEAALDLSKRAAAVKVESPPPLQPPPHHSERSSPIEPTTTTQLVYWRHNPYAFDTQTVPLPSLSPRVSPDSSSLYCEPFSPPPPSLSPRSSPGEGPRVSCAPRPFKTVTSSLPLARECGGGGAVTAASASAAPEPGYAAFRSAMLDAMRARNGGTLCVSNPRMRRAVRRSQPQPDQEYLQRRARNNAAAKRSRDLRRLKEDELAIRTAYLEQINQSLRLELEAARRQLARVLAAPPPPM